MTERIGDWLRKNLFTLPPAFKRDVGAVFHKDEAVITISGTYAGVLEIVASELKYDFASKINEHLISSSIPYQLGLLHSGFTPHDNYSTQYWFDYYFQFLIVDEDTPFKRQIDMAIAQLKEKP